MPTMRQLLNRYAARSVPALGALVSERDRLRRVSDQLRIERDQLQTERDQLRVERDRLQTERDQLRVERDRLQTERDQLQTERDAPQTEPDQRSRESALHQELINASANIRIAKERNQELKAQIAKRDHDTESNNETYRTQVLFHDVLMHDMHQHIVLNTIVRQAMFGEPSPCPLPPREIPQELLEQFTRGGRIKITDHWVDDTYPSNYPLVYTDAEIECYLRRIDEDRTYIYGGLDLSVRAAFSRYGIKGKHVVNLGSITPWYEATLLHFGAQVTTLDYNTIITYTDKIKTLVVSDKSTELSFDAALSISSFEHDGLGAYGDPVDPDGDLKAMQRLRKIVKPGGLLFLNVPVGADEVMWNRARVYGKVRLPLLIKDWTWIDSFGFREEFLDGRSSGDPLLVLRND